MGLNKMPLYQWYKDQHFQTKVLINRKLALIEKIVKKAGWVDVAHNQSKTKGQEKRHATPAPTMLGGEHCNGNKSIANGSNDMNRPKACIMYTS